MWWRVKNIEHQLNDPSTIVGGNMLCIELFFCLPYVQTIWLIPFTWTDSSRSRGNFEGYKCVKYYRYTVAWPSGIGPYLRVHGGSHRHSFGELEGRFVLSTFSVCDVDAITFGQANHRPTSYVPDHIMATSRLITSDSIVSSKWSLCVFGDAI